ncbi:pyridoxamine 5'-phosphate oxidase family protein [Thiocapsa sp.]|uniref:pyridoxamine 5'-phosphate oxidase family protein n=1 Tax=Thiocapsa sp. TaxID=2024551 RepID=UPI002BE77806|nr:pyridoxamine 5'-phosphate oxidase family protein [Thiocapsa sp.]HSO84291.1 pyridoxamine 5'-phosphate oxidase family protein [Thiocapsa sp.]
MGLKFDALSEQHIRFIAEQKIFFVATATEDSRVNLSPKGMDALRVVDERRVLWLNLTGSGNETSAHVQQDPRMTLMFCAFEDPPMILRVYGAARVVHPGDPGWADLLSLFKPFPGARQIFDLAVDLVQTSCGMGVPYFAYGGDREQLVDWAVKKGEEGVRDYWEQKNQLSIDGTPTRILDRER